MKDIIFISHSNPEDNDFTLWLASRLRLMGYNVWCDIDGLLGGEITWDEINDMIRNKSIKFLIVVSKNLCKEPGKLRKGVQDEFRLAESLSKDVEGDFVIPLKIDDVSHNFYIGFNTYNNIPFFNNWAEGFKQLIKKLEKDNVVKKNKSDNKAFAEWYENEYTTKHGIIKKKETYYSNWWEIKELPEQFYIFQYDDEVQAKQVFYENKNYPIVLHGDCVISFEEQIVEPKRNSLLGEYVISYKKKHTINIQSIINETYQSTSFPNLSDCQNILKWLLNNSFAFMMKEKYLYFHVMSGKKRAYYYPRSYKDQVSFLYRGKKKTKVLSGKYLSSFWHVAVSARAQLKPIISYSLKTHILFSNEGERIWQDDQQLHSARRKKGKNWFNKEWRDILFAFINALKDEYGTIEIDLNSKFVLKLSDTTYHFTSQLGYNEPQKDRQGVLQREEEVEELIEEIDNKQDEEI